MKITKLLCAALMVGALASCSDDEPKSEEKTFTDQTGLVMTVNNAPMVGKTVTYTPGADDTKATLTVTSQFDLSLIPGIESEGQMLAGPGAIPGSKELVLPVRLTDNDGNHALFSGAYETQYCTFNYNGELTDETLTLNFTDVLLKNTSIAGDYKTLPYAIDSDFDSDNYGAILANPIYLEWESDAPGINLFGTPVPPKGLISMVMVMGLINNNQLTVPQALNEALQGVSFTESGDVIAKIKEDIANAGAPVVTSPANLAQYVLTGGNSMLFFLNPQAIAAEDDKTRADLGIDFSNIFGNAIAQLAPMLGDGVPMRYKVEGKNMTVYLGTETLLPLLKQISPLLKDEAIIAKVVEMASADPTLGMFAGALPDMLKSLADVIDQTTKIEVGINLVKE